MSFTRYPGYRESDVPWIGNIPSNWRLLPFFSQFPERKESNKGMRSANLLSLSYGRIVKKDINTLEGLLPASYETYQIVHKDDIVFRLTDLQNDKRSLRSAIVSEEGIITSAYLAVIPQEFNASFASYLFRAYDLMKVFYSMGGGLRQSMKYDDMKWLPIVAPSIPEQTQIARFLDHETDKIETLILEQERLIELLQEKRQAVISQAVTKGLDPNVPMKDSGVEWLGQVPAHWSVKRIKYTVSSFEQGWSPQCESQPVEDEHEIGVLKVGCVNRGIFRVEENKKLPDDLSLIPHLTVKADDLLVSRANTRELVGNAAVSTIDHPNLMISDKLFRIRFDQEQASPHYVSFFLSTSAARREIELAATGASSSMLNIGQGTLLEMPLPCPPVEEQKDIRDKIMRQTYRLLALIAEATKLMARLQERRSALISAAVTGKIDVRDWRPPADESAFDGEVRPVGVEVSV